MQYARTLFFSIFAILLTTPAFALTYLPHAYFDPNPAQVGQTVTLHTSLATTADSGYFIGGLTSVSFNINWGDSTSNTYSPGSYAATPSGQTSYTFNWAFTHTYTSPASFLVTDDLSFFLNECNISTPTICNPQLLHPFTFPSIQVTPATTPLPSSLLLFVSALGMLGLFGWGVKRKMKGSLKNATILVAALSAMGTTSSFASTYNYTGSPLTLCLNGGAICTPSTASLHGSFTASSLIIGATNQSIDPLLKSTNFSFTDGTTILNGKNLASTSSVRISTDSNGNITDWTISLALNSGYPEFLSSSNPTSISYGNILRPSTAEVYDQDVSGSSSATYYSTSAGSWTNADISATPLPSSLSLFISGFAVMGLFGWGVKRKMENSMAAV